MPIAYQIARCESGHKQYELNGSVRRGRVNPKDIGFFQISETYWLDTSIRLGYDIHTFEGNLKMAKYIYDQKKSFDDWKHSGKCWERSKVTQLLALR